MWADGEKCGGKSAGRWKRLIFAGRNASGGGRNPVRTREEDNKEERDEEFYGFVCLGGQSFLAAGSADGVGFVLVGGAVVPRACSLETVCVG